MSEEKIPQEDSEKEERLVNIPAKLKKILEDPGITISEAKKEELSELVEYTITKKFSGPLPPPEILEHYNHVVKDGAERIVSIA